MSNPDTLQKTAPNKVASPAPSVTAPAVAASSAGPVAATPPKQSFNYAAAASSAKALAGKGAPRLTKDSSTAASIHASPSAANSIPRQAQSMSTTGSPSLNHSTTSRDGQAGNGHGDAAALTESAKANGSGRGASPVSMAKRSLATSSNGESPSLDGNISQVADYPFCLPGHVLDLFPALLCHRQSALTSFLSFPAAGINFGAPHDNDATLSSSPAGPAQLGSNAPTKFGSVEADAKVNKEKVAGSGPTRSLDLNKLFQGTPQTPSKSTPPTSNGSLGPESAGASSLTPRTPSTATSSSLRGSAAAQRNFEPQRSPSAQPFHPMNAQSGAWPPQQQQPRSPHLGHQSNMQPMAPMGAPPHWQGQQMVSAQILDSIKRVASRLTRISHSTIQTCISSRTDIQACLNSSSSSTRRITCPSIGPHHSQAMMPARDSLDRRAICPHHPWGLILVHRSSQMDLCSRLHLRLPPRLAYHLLLHLNDLSLTRLQRIPAPLPLLSQVTNLEWVSHPIEAVSIRARLLLPMLILPRSRLQEP